MTSLFLYGFTVLAQPRCRPSEHVRNGFLLWVCVSQAAPATPQFLSELSTAILCFYMQLIVRGTKGLNPSISTAAEVSNTPLCFSPQLANHKHGVKRLDDPSTLCSDSYPILYLLCTPLAFEIWQEIFCYNV